MVTRSEITAAMDPWVSARHKGAVSARYKGAVSAFPGRRTRMMMPMSDVIVQHTPAGQLAGQSTHSFGRSEALQRSGALRRIFPRECRWASGLRVVCGNGDVHPKRFPISASAAAQNPQPASRHPNQASFSAQSGVMRSIEGQSGQVGALEIGVEPGGCASR